MVWLYGNRQGVAYRGWGGGGAVYVSYFVLLVKSTPKRIISGLKTNFSPSAVYGDRGVAVYGDRQSARSGCK